MRLKRINDHAAGLLLLWAVLLALHLTQRLLPCPAPGERFPTGGVFVQITGDVPHPGVYRFSHQPSWAELLQRAAGEALPTPAAASGTGDGVLPEAFPSGTRVEISQRGAARQIDRGRMSAFFRITLGLPISLNQETVEGLTAVPGIGPRLAEAIVEERARRGGFQDVKELRAVRGVGEKVFNRISPLLTL